MNRLVLCLCLSLIFMMPRAFGAVKPSPYPNPYRQTAWNNITDGINTLGEDPEQKKMALRKLHNQRTRNRLKNISEANRAKLKAKHQAWLNSQ